MSYEIGKNLKRKKSGKKIFRAEKQLARKYKEEIIVKAMENLEFEDTKNLTFAEFRAYFYKSLLWEHSKAN
jgi:hypothetical protein